MAAPIITYTDGNGVPLPFMNFGVTNAGNISGGFAIQIWNNKSNLPGISDAINSTITTKTFNGLDGGDDVTNGNEIVTNQMINVQCQSAGQTSYSPMGGSNIISISDSPPQAGNTPPPPTIHSGMFASCLLRANIPSSATQGNINFLIRVTCQYN